MLPENTAQLKDKRRCDFTKGGHAKKLASQMAKFSVPSALEKFSGGRRDQGTGKGLMMGTTNGGAPLPCSRQLSRQSGLILLLVDRRLEYGGGLMTKEATPRPASITTSIRSIISTFPQTAVASAIPDLEDRVTYITCCRGQAHRDGTALVFGRDPEGDSLPNATARFSKKDAEHVPRLEPARRRNHRAHSDPGALRRAAATGRARRVAGENRDWAVPFCC